MSVNAYSSYWPTTSDAATGGTAVGGYWPAVSDDTTASGGSSLWKHAGGASFHDLLDIINPLQHLPVIGTVYRWATGDEPGNVARVIGDGIYGGPMGLATGLINAVTRDGDGEDLGEQIMVFAFGPGHAKAAPDHATSAIAAAAPAGQNSPAAASPVAASPLAAKPAPIAATKLADLTPAPAAASVEASPAALPAAGSTRSVAAVAALYRSTDPAAHRAAASTSTAAAATIALPDHAPIPLARTAASAPADSMPGGTVANVTDDPAHQLSAQNAMLQRQITAGRAGPAPGATQLVNTPVPLQLTGQTLPARQRVATPAAQPAPGPTVAGSTVAGSTTTGASVAELTPTTDPAKPAQAPAAPTDLAVGTPAEISQKMMTALDKYTRLQQQEHAAATTAGSEVDVSP